VRVLSITSLDLAAGTEKLAHLLTLIDGWDTVHPPFAQTNVAVMNFIVNFGIEYLKYTILRGHSICGECLSNLLIEIFQINIPYFRAF